MVVGYRAYRWLAVFLLTSTAWGVEPTTIQGISGLHASILLGTVYPDGKLVIVVAYLS
jgi:hypothetical protein